MHVVAPFLLTTALLPILQTTPDARVITVSSGGMYTQRLDLDALATPAMPFNGVRAYANAKRAQVVLNERWSKHCGASGVVFHAMHPGLGRHARSARVAAALSRAAGSAAAHAESGSRHDGVVGDRSARARDERAVLAGPPAAIRRPVARYPHKRR